MLCTINWNSLNISEWEQRFNSVRRASLLQSPAYAETLFTVKHLGSRRGLIMINGQEAGIVQILETGLFKNIIHAVMLDRGPLWFEGYGEAAHIGAFIKEFSRQFPCRLGRRRRFIPETEGNPGVLTYLEEAGFRAVPGEPYETIWLDLAKDQEDLRKNLKKNWRGALQKAQKAGITVQWDEGGEYLSWFLAGYAADKGAKNYDGPDENLLSALAVNFAKNKNLLIGRALMNHKPIAGILVLCHGASATYQAGWTTTKGRDISAHHLLLWEALTILKGKHIRDFDLGGINEHSASGIKKFKEGLGGQRVRLSGLYT